MAHFPGSALDVPSIPLALKGSVRSLDLNDEVLYWYPWLQKIATTDTYIYLGAPWPTDAQAIWPECPPAGFSNYIVSGDSLMIGWGEELSRHLRGNIIQLFQSIIPPDFPRHGCGYHVYNTAHLRIARLARRMGIDRRSVLTKNIRYKASALTNRITQSKVIVFSAIKDLLPDQDAILSLHKNLRESRNVHGWAPTANAVCDYYTALFRERYADITISLPGDDGVSWSFNNPAYQEAALNFTQESYHYSLDGAPGHDYMRPGPFLTEKTWKCLLSETAFIPVGQYHSYDWLESMGLEFDYGVLDLSFDAEPGDLDRLEKIVSVIGSLNDLTAQEIFEMTRRSSTHNRQWVLSDEFFARCEKDNEIFYDFLHTLK